MSKIPRRAELAENPEINESKEQKITPEISEINYTAGLKKAEVLITQLTDKLIGVYGKSLLDSRFGQIINMSDGVEEVLKNLSFPEQDSPPANWHSLYDDKMFTLGTEDRRHNVEMSDYIGRRVIAGYSTSGKGESSYNIFGKEVTKEHYEQFKKEVNKMLDKNYKQRKCQNPRLRELPASIKSKVDKMRYDDETERVLQSGEIVKAGELKFIHPREQWKYNKNNYNRTVVAYDLAKWKKGERIKKHVEFNNRKGYIDDTVNMPPNTILISKTTREKGGKRHEGWEDIYICE